MLTNTVYADNYSFMLVSTTSTTTFSTAWQRSLPLALTRGMIKRHHSYTPYGAPVLTFTGPVEGYLDAHPELLL